MRWIVLLLGMSTLACEGARREREEEEPRPTRSDGCAKDTDCKGDRVCVRGECQDAKASPKGEGACAKDNDCKGDRICVKGACQAPSASPSDNPAAGEACQRYTAKCKDGSTFLSCHDGKFIEVRCKGKKGCTSDAQDARCDFSDNAVGDTCSSDMDAHAMCSGDGKGMIACRSGKFELDSCRGPKGCKQDGDKATCDNSLLAEGDGCGTTTGYFCSPDRKAIVECKAGKGVTKQRCENNATCQQTGASELSCVGRAPPPRCPPGDPMCSDI